MNTEMIRLHMKLSFMEMNRNNNMNSWKIHQKNCGNMSKITMEAWMYVPTYLLGLRIWRTILYVQTIRHRKGFHSFWAL